MVHFYYYFRSYSPPVGHLVSLVFTSCFPVHVSMTVKAPPLLTAYWLMTLTAGTLKREDVVHWGYELLMKSMGSTFII